MFKPKYGSVSLEKLSECASKTGIKLMSFCECGKKSMTIRSSGMKWRINGALATEDRKGNGNNGLLTCMVSGDIPK